MFHQILQLSFGGLAKYRLAQMFQISTKAYGGILPNACSSDTFCEGA